jgi:CRP-like cAMP-binding protein
MFSASFGSGFGEVYSSAQQSNDKAESAVASSSTDIQSILSHLNEEDEKHKSVQESKENPLNAPPGTHNHLEYYNDSHRIIEDELQHTTPINHPHKFALQAKSTANSSKPASAKSTFTKSNKSCSSSDISNSKPSALRSSAKSVKIKSIAAAASKANDREEEAAAHYINPERFKYPIFEVDKFLRSNSHLSTDSERVAALAALKVPNIRRTAQDFSTIAKFLQTIDLFQHFKLDVCVELAKLCRYSKFIKDAIIYKRGSESNMIYIILTGAVGTRVKKNSQKTTKNSQDSSSAKTNYNNSENITENPKELAEEPAEPAELEEDDETSDHSHFLDRSVYTIAAVLQAGENFGTEGLVGTGLGSNFRSKNSRRADSTVAAELTQLLSLDIYEYHATIAKFSNAELIEKLNFLSNHKAFSACSSREIYGIAGQLKTEKFGQNEVILKQNGPAEHFYLIKTGQCGVIYTTNLTEHSKSSRGKEGGTTENSRDLLHIRTLNKGEFFGELALFNAQNEAADDILFLSSANNCSPLRSCSIISNNSVELYSLSSLQFFSLFPLATLQYIQHYGNSLYYSIGPANEASFLAEYRQQRSWRNYKQNLIEKITSAKSKQIR